ncbi:MAG: paraquat-inducible protein A [Alteromonadaceae bacterium]|jgi:paraquat-inducible protein A
MGNVISQTTQKHFYRKVLSACPYCDLLIKRHNMTANQYSICPRCHSKVEHKHGYDPVFLKWTVMAALFFYIPANFYPLVTVEIAGSVQQTSVYNGIVLLLQQNKLITAAIVLFCSLLVPTLIAGTFVVLLFLRNYNMLFGVQKYCVRMLIRLREWAMMDIYLLSFFVTIIKIRDLGEVQMEIGLAAYLGMTLCINKLFISYDRRALWRLITKGNADCE